MSRQHYGRVVSVAESAIICTIDDDPSSPQDVESLPNYAPRVGDAALLIHREASWVAIGSLATPQSLRSGPAPHRR